MASVLFFEFKINRSSVLKLIISKSEMFFTNTQRGFAVSRLIREIKNNRHFNLCILLLGFANSTRFMHNKIRIFMKCLRF